MEEQVALFIFIHTCMYGYLQTHGTNFLPCDEKRLNCCSGYMLEENEGRCVKCPVGYFGTLCQTPCRFPLYGQYCQTRCNCERSECNHIEGCYLANSTAFVTQTSAILKEEVSVNLNQDLGSRTNIYVSIAEDRPLQNRDYPPSSTYMYMPNIDDSASWMSSIRMSIFILVGLCILLMILYAASFGIKLRKTEHEPHLIQLEARDDYSI